MEKIISASNTITFKVGGDRISAIPEAIHALGFERIRNLAISILLVENSSQLLNPYEQREIAGLSICSGLMAQFLARNENFSLDPDLAFVCSSLRNYGKLLMTSFLIDEYREAKILGPYLGNDQAFQSVFGLQPLHLGRYLLTTSHLPRNITDSLRDISPQAFAELAESPEEQLPAISELTVRLSEVTFDARITPDQFDASMQRTLDCFEKNLPIELDEITLALAEIDSNLQEFTQTIGTDSSAAPTAGILKARINGERLPELPAEAKHAQLKALSRIKSETSPEEKEALAEANFQEALNLISIEESKQTIDNGKIYHIATQAVQEGLGLTSVMAFIREEHETESFAARFGHGHLFKAIRNRPFVSERKPDIFGICINRKEDILIQDVNAGKIRSVIPDWINTDESNASLIILPIMAEKEVFAIILGSLDKGAIQLSKSDHRRLKDIRLLLTDLESQRKQSILS